MPVGEGESESKCKRGRASKREGGREKEEWIEFTFNCGISPKHNLSYS